MGMGAGQPGGQQPAAGGKGQAPQGGQPPAAGGKGQAPQGGQQPGMGGKGQPGGQGGQQVNLPGYAQPYYQNLISQQQPGMGGNGQPGGQQLQVRSQPEVFNSPFSPQQREQYLQSENLANYPPIPQVQQPYGGFGQQPGMGGQQFGTPSPQQAVPQDLIRPLPGMGGQQGPQQSQAFNDFLQQRGLPANLMQPGMGGQQPQVSLPQGMAGQQPGMGGQQGTPPNIASLLANPQFRALLGGGKQGQQPPQPPQMSQQDYNQQMKNFAMQRDQARRQGLDEHSIQRQQLDLVRNYAAQRGPQPTNPLAQPQQLRPEDPRMMAMRNLQQLQRG